MIFQVSLPGRMRFFDSVLHLSIVLPSGRLTSSGFSCGGGGASAVPSKEATSDPESDTLGLESFGGSGINEGDRCGGDSDVTGDLSLLLSLPFSDFVDSAPGKFANVGTAA